MAKKNTEYQCPNCGHREASFTAKCRKCGKFNPFEEVAIESSSSEKTSGIKSVAQKPSKGLKKIGGTTTRVERFATGIGELDRVLGGGLVEAEVALIGAKPGAGKSSLALMLANRFAQDNKKVIYFSGEESEHQISLRAERFGVSSDNIMLSHTTSLEEIRGHIDEVRPDFFIVDSLQTVASKELTSGLGSIAQSKEAAHALTNDAKRLGIRALLINQVTKDDDFAGSSAIQHIVDVSLFLESDKDSPLKFLRAYKNRFGTIDEVGIFQHVENGLEGVTDPSGIFVESDFSVPGIGYGMSAEGIRQIPVEIQALVTPSTMSNPRRRFNGVNQRRGEIICPILDKSIQTNLNSYDVYVSTFGGVRVEDPLSDLAVAAAIYSSRKECSTDKRTAFVGELTPVGQVRGNYQIEQKVAEAQRMGFDRIVVPVSAKISKKWDIKIEKIDSIKNIHRFFVKEKQ